jgi:hypothetical protein
MSGESTNSTTIDAVVTVNDAVNSIETITAQGAGKAYQAVAHSTSISIQDGTDYMRNVLTIATAGIGVATAQLIATKDMTYAEIISKIQEGVNGAVTTVKSIGVNAGGVLKDFPNGK